MTPIPEPEVVGQILAIPLAHIAVGERLRPIDPVWAAALGKIMSAEGQKTPIEVHRLPGRRGYVLVAGGHRLEGARLEGWPTIKAIVVDSNALERRLREVSENLWRKGLDPIDRASFVAELVTLKKLQHGLDPEKDGRAASAQARWSAKRAEKDATDTMSAAYGWAAEIGAQLGFSGRTLRRDLELHRGLLPEVAAKLRGHPVASNSGQLRALARLSEDDQRAAAELIRTGAAKGASDAVATLRQRPKPSPEAKAWSAFFGGWSRMSAAKRREALRELAEQGLPKGVSITFDGGEQ